MAQNYWENSFCVWFLNSFYAKLSQAMPIKASLLQNNCTVPKAISQVLFFQVTFSHSHFYLPNLHCRGSPQLNIHWYWKYWPGVFFFFILLAVACVRSISTGSLTLAHICQKHRATKSCYPGIRKPLNNDIILLYWIPAGSNLICVGCLVSWFACDWQYLWFVSNMSVTTRSRSKLFVTLSAVKLCDWV